MKQGVKSIKTTVAIALLLCVTACATQLPIAPLGHGFDPLRHNHRVLFRDLTTPVYHRGDQKGADPS